MSPQPVPVNEDSLCEYMLQENVLSTRFDPFVELHILIAAEVLHIHTQIRQHDGPTCIVASRWLYTRQKKEEILHWQDHIITFYATTITLKAFYLLLTFRHLLTHQALPPLELR